MCVTHRFTSLHGHGPSVMWGIHGPPRVSWAAYPYTANEIAAITHLKRSHVRILWYFHFMSPEVRGRPIEIAFLPALRAHRGKLLSGHAVAGRDVHAGTFLRQRRIVLDAALK